MKGFDPKWKDFPDYIIGITKEIWEDRGIATLDHAEAHLAHVDGVMIGRAAYHTPDILADVDRRFFGDAGAGRSPRDAVLAMLPYVEEVLADGGRLAHVTRHMLGLFHGQPGARQWRRILSVEAVRPNAGSEVILKALAALDEAHTPEMSAA